ncbi:hypothetical protein INT48_001674 [Thamnidium elegans]|uniref:Uncharacterized protein n=1 Tax=Thamnidium elegans TaxID=101142 RepID=A0A8H7SMC2_9FUNG|nr:hypothetical protein INT48_001674 [Thamnidium elegans]
MATLVSLVLNNADRLPIVGSPIGQATTWYRRKSNSSEVICETPPPPPYEKEPVHSRLTQISDYVWKRASFSSTQPQSTATSPEVITTLTSTLDKKQVDDGISLLQMATQMNQETSGKHNQMSIELYMMGLDKILASIPIDSDSAIKVTLQNKLFEFKQRNGLVFTAVNLEKKPLTEQEQKEALGGLSNLIIQAAVLGALAIKKSPLPGIMTRVLQIARDGLIKIDETCSIRERTLHITSAGLSKAIELDQHYEVHQFFAEIFYTGCTAVLKAGIAYAEEENQS